MCTISVIIPVYNVELYLQECLDSVLAQTFDGDLEIICVDDGSTDRSTAILGEYKKKDSRIKVIRQKNGGLSSARNTGMDAATGDFLYFLDSDDMITSDALSRLVELAEHEHLDQIIFGTEVFAESGHATDEDISAKHEYYSIPHELCGRVWTGRELFKSLVSRHAFFVSVPLRFFRKSALPQNLKFPEGVIHEDNYFSPLALIWAKRAMLFPFPLYQRRIRLNSIMTSTDNTNRHTVDYMKIWSKLRVTPLRPRWFDTARQPYILFMREIYCLSGYHAKTLYGQFIVQWQNYGFLGIMRMLKSLLASKLKKIL